MAYLKFWIEIPQRVLQQSEGVRVYKDKVQEQDLRKYV